MIAPIEVTVPTSETPAPGLNLGDLYYIFFRHKWKILLIFLAGLLGSVTYFFSKPPMFQSETKILVRYIVEGKPITSAKDESQVRDPDSGGGNIISSEIEILTSFDLAALVVDTVGPEKILAKLGGGDDRLRAAAVISKGLKVEVPGRGSVLLRTFRHPDATVVQPVLNQLVDTYFKRHIEIHRGVGVLDESFLRQVDQARARLSTTEAELKRLKAEVQVISLEESKRASTDLMKQLREQLLTAKADLAEHRALLGAPAQPLPAPLPTTNTEAVLPAESAELYRRACRDLATLPTRLAELRTLYTDEHFQVRQLRQQVTEAERRKKELEAVYPSLARLTPTPIPGDLPTESLRVAALAARVQELSDQLGKVQADASRVMEAEPAITQLQRQKEVEENSLRLYSASLAQSRIDGSLGTGKSTNISVVETPTPPTRDIKAVLKKVLIIFFLGCSGGFGLGFVIERIFDRTIKGVLDVERQARIPLFLTVPDTAWHLGIRIPWFGRQRPKPRMTASGPGEPTTGVAPAAPAPAVAPWDPNHELRSHFEALRDRLITYSEVRGMDHKPKMVAVTSYHHGAGVTTMAAGLAAALSETGDGNVLLVDMNLEQGAAHDFYQGKLACGLSEALENGTRDSACLQDNLYLVSARESNNQELSRVLPKRFAHLVPRMKASDYDYIIFDMPPVTQTSVTPRLAGFMDMVLVVIESEKTGSEIVRRANGLLAESRANLGAVLNKHRAYVPQKFSQEL